MILGTPPRVGVDEGRGPIEEPAVLGVALFTSGEWEVFGVDWFWFHPGPS